MQSVTPPQKNAYTLQWPSLFPQTLNHNQEKNEFRAVLSVRCISLSLFKHSCAEKKLKMQSFTLEQVVVVVKKIAALSCSNAVILLADLRPRDY